MIYYDTHTPLPLLLPLQVDMMRVPRPFPLLHKQHIVYYSNRNKTSFFELLDKYRNDHVARKTVAVNGYLHTLKYHRAISFIDYVFRTLHIKMSTGGGGSDVWGIAPNYTDTGFMMRNIISLTSTKRARLQVSVV